MERIDNLENISSLKENRILLEGGTTEDINFVNSQAVFIGKNNILFIEKGTNIHDSTFYYEGDNSVIYVSKNRNKLLLNIDIYHDSVFYIGQDNYMNGRINAVLSEQKHCVIGDYGLFSFGVWIRTADPHIIYDIDTKERTNLSKSIFLGDHSWMGQNVLLLKGTKIGSGSAVGAMGLVGGKTIPSNTIWGGNPAKQLKDNVWFTTRNVHFYKEEETEKSMIKDKDNFIYKYEEGKTISFDEIDKGLSNAKGSEAKLEYIKERIRGYKEKNRFYIGK